MAHFTRFEAGPAADWPTWEFAHPAFSRPTRGKLFLRERVRLTGMEVSLNSLPPGAAVPFLHTHRAHEELYLFLSGSGEFVVDGERFAVQPGTVVKVDPAGARSWRNSGEMPLTYVVVQAKADSVTCDTIADGEVVKDVAPW